MRILFVILLLLVAPAYAWDGAQTDSCGCEDYRAEYLPSALSGTDDIMHLTVTFVGLDDSTGWVIAGTKDHDSLLLALETGLNDRFGGAGMVFDVAGNWVNNTIFTKYMAFAATETWTHTQKIFTANPYTTFNIVGSAHQTSGAKHNVYGTPVDTTYSYTYVMHLQNVSNDWREVSHELGHEWGLHHTHAGVLTSQAMEDWRTCPADSITNDVYEYPHHFWAAGIRDSMGWVRGDLCPDTDPDPTFGGTAPYNADTTHDRCSDSTWLSGGTTHVMTNLMSYGPTTTSGPDSVTAHQLGLVRCYLETHPVFSRMVTWVE